jgi:hypothetical protein
MDEKYSMCVYVCIHVALGKILQGLEQQIES